jgi:xanthine dehydrogenase large subunit
MDLSAVRDAPGVVAVFTAADIPGDNNVGPLRHDEPLLADGEVHFAGQPLFLVAAHSHDQARRAARLGKVDYEPLPAHLTVAEALAADDHLEPTQRMARGDAQAALANSPHRLSGRLEIGAGAFLPRRPDRAGHADGGWPDPYLVIDPAPFGNPASGRTSAGQTQRGCDGRGAALGGGFGGKETQATAPAAACALVALKTGRRPVCAMTATMTWC